MWEAIVVDMQWRKSKPERLELRSLQIIDEMTMRIASGAYKPGEKLPSVRDLSMEAGVNPNTMQKAMAELEQDDAGKHSYRQLHLS